MLRRRAALGSCGVVAVCLLSSAASSAPLRAGLKLQASRGAIRFGRSVRLSGHLSGHPAPGTPVTLRSSAYPYKPGQVREADGETGPNGRFRFAASPARNTRYRAYLPDRRSVHSPPVKVIVDPADRFMVRKLPLGRVKITIRIRHARGLPWNGRPAIWYLGERSHALHRMKATRSAWSGRGATRLTAELHVPRAGRFHYATCLGAAARGAMGPPADRRRCGADRFRGGRRATLQSHSRAPFGFPSRKRIASAASYLHDRTGRKSFAVVTSEGRIYGRAVHRTFVSASVVKAMLLVAYLRMVAADHRDLDSNDRSILNPMIEVSDNSAATRAWEVVGNERLQRLAGSTGMTDFSIEGDWASAQISAADQARFFFAMHGALPRRFRGYADYLLSHIAGYESWGIPAVARPAGWSVYFKGGWRGTDLGELVHQVGRLQSHRGRIAIAVMTDGDPSMDYGIGTIEGVTAHLVR
jgi:hypothetical protein